MLPLVRPRLDDRQLIDWIRLLRTEGIGPRTFQSLVNHCGGAGEAIRALPELSRRRGAAVVPATVQDAEREIAQARRLGARFVAIGEAEYPTALATVDGAPPLIAVCGVLDLSASPLVAVVGSRNASAAGLQMAGRLSRDVGGAGFGIVSGLARGIDAEAHRAAMATGTIAVLAGGLDRLYPEENRALFDAMRERGAVVSEMPFGWVARGRDFPRRNRIVSGLALGTIVVEAARKSGSLITARFALEQGREVFAVPGSPLDLRAEGPNDLIRQGATLVRDAADVLEVLQPLVGREFEPRAVRERADDPPEFFWDESEWLRRASTSAEPVAPRAADVGDPRARVVGLLTSAPIDPDELARAACVPIRDLTVILFALEAEGLIERHAGGQVSRRF